MTPDAPKQLDLSAANFRDAKLARSTFCDVDLSQAVFEDANFRAARFTDVDFTDATIADSQLGGMRIDRILVSELLRVSRAARE